ncbi:NlpC/P60 family protein [Romboutsia sp. 1001216sp1]|uniref:C40 family peptidase n=1 Tax=unclassified Romboutsia TaxID=2626894 RepID=UPI001FAC3167|nr:MULTISPECIES: NlpC/P60 family protein [unclassified Romboutsia]MDB8803184.1 NlpC/P60 family protein [Romboutsia sp. 1001216sp1]MDB8814543.1 NlpC/P60 family protein [Romboutsia sp. 1001216sp1]
MVSQALQNKSNGSNTFKRINTIKLIIKMIISTNLSSLFFIFVFISGLMMFIGASSSSNTVTGEFANGSLSGVPEAFIPYYNEASEIYKIPNWVLAAITKQESNFNPNDSYGGAYGLMQVQKYDSGCGEDLWQYLMNLGLADIYKKSGYSFSSSEDMWRIYLKDPRAQVIGGSYEIRYYANYVLYKQNKVKKLDYNNSENMKLINWQASPNDCEFKDTLRRIFACYNGGPRYGMNVNLDKARFNYPNNVFGYAMEFRSTALVGNIVKGDNTTIEKAIQTGMPLVGRCPYVWGGGRTQSDIDKRRFDCSSFVHWCYASAGINLGDFHSVVTDSLVTLGTKIDPKNMRRGDIIFFNTYKYNGHVAIYLGGNQFLHCGSSRGVEISKLDSPYWTKVFNGNVRRVVQ